MKKTEESKTRELKFVLTTPHGSQIEISKKKDSETIFLQYKGNKLEIARAFGNVNELCEHLKQNVFSPVFEILS